MLWFMERLKACTKCGTTKEATDFRARKSAKDGLTSWCRSCLNEASKFCMRDHVKKPGVRERMIENDKARYQRLKDDPAFQEKQRERAKEYCARPEVKVAAAERNRKWIAANPERALESKRRWVGENREKAREYWRTYYQTDRGRQKHKLQEMKRRAWKRGSECTITEEQWLAVLGKWEGRCAYCRSEVKITLEHVAPLSRGGADSIENIVPACHSCNSRKNCRTVERFLPPHEVVTFFSEWATRMP